MGASLSKPEQGNVAEKGNTSETLSERGARDRRVYAEIIRKKGETELNSSNFPPLHVLINEQIASSAIDSLRDSQNMAKQLAKDMVIDVFKDKRSPSQFGKLLGYIFDNESILSPTRWLIYWSIATDDAYSNALYQSRWQINTYVSLYAKNQLMPLTTWWLASPRSRKETINPLIAWSMIQQDFVQVPVANLVAESLPFAQSATSDALRNIAVESLRSKIIKESAKSGLIDYMRRSAGNSESG